jgi:hypothetical protein
MWMLNLIRYRLQVTTGPDFSRIIYCHGDSSPQTYHYIAAIKKEFPNLEHHQGLVKIATNPLHGQLLLLVDDLHPEVRRALLLLL